MSTPHDRIRHSLRIQVFLRHEISVNLLTTSLMISGSWSLTSQRSGSTSSMTADLSSRSMTRVKQASTLSVSFKSPALRSKTAFVFGRTNLRIIWSSSDGAMLVTATSAALCLIPTNNIIRIKSSLNVQVANRREKKENSRSRESGNKIKVHVLIEQ